MGCPTPHKRKHTNREQAEAVISRMWREGRNQRLPVRAYHCPCGMWHTTSKPKLTKQQDKDC